MINKLLVIIIWQLNSFSEQYFNHKLQRSITNEGGYILWLLQISTEQSPSSRARKWFNDSTFLQSIPAYSDSVAKYSVVTRHWRGKITRFRSFYDLNWLTEINCTKRKKHRRESEDESVPARWLSDALFKDLCPPLKFFWLIMFEI